MHVGGKVVSPKHRAPFVSCHGATAPVG